MAQVEQLSLSWDAHQKSICGGLSLLQQRGEFVDMTLAADGHHVKVHQMVLSLVSPYIKDLISTAQCQHPVIFLSNISYTTLCAILEYIYTGEVVVPKHRLADLIAAGKALHIKGLREMDNEHPGDPSSPSKTTSLSEKLRAHREKKKGVQPKEETEPVAPICKVYLDEDNDSHHDSSMDINESSEVCENIVGTTETINNSNSEKSIDMTSEASRKTLLSQKLQYTVSNQGGLQVIFNRYIYHLRYFGKKNRRRFWRCVDYSSCLKCPANICTDDNNQVTERSFTHNHAFHDSKILKKLRDGIIYSLFQEAENKADGKKKGRHIQCLPTSDEKSE